MPNITDGLTSQQFSAGKKPQKGRPWRASMPSGARCHRGVWGRILGRLPVSERFWKAWLSMVAGIADGTISALTHLFAIAGRWSNPGYAVSGNMLIKRDNRSQETCSIRILGYCICLPGSANEQFGLILGAHSSMEGLVIVNLEASTTVEKWTLVKIADAILLCYIVWVLRCYDWDYILCIILFFSEMFGQMHASCQLYKLLHFIECAGAGLATSFYYYILEFSGRIFQLWCSCAHG